jgi:hypothetical protein
MQILSTLNRNALIATMIAATGLPTAMANAQFKVEYDTKVKAAAKEQKENKDEHVIVIQNHDDKNEYEVKIVNGKVELAEMNGEELDHDRIKVKEHVVIFLSEDGKELTEIKLPSMAGWSEKGPKGASFAWTAATPDAPDAPRPTLVETIAPTGAPKVMLGINLTEPSDAVRKQLKLGDVEAIFVEKVIEGLPAMKAGLEDYDVIVSIDGSEYADGELLSNVLRKKEPGDPLKLVVLRGGEKLKLKAKLAPYNAQQLGTTVISIEEDGDVEFPAIWEGQNGNGFTFDMDFDFGPEIHEKIHEALQASGLNEEQLATVEAQLHEHLGGLHERLAQGNRFFFAQDAHGEDHDHDEAHERIMMLERQAMERAEQIEREAVELYRSREFAEIAKDKARAAMRDAERQVMELRDGRLFVRQAEEVEHHLSELEDRLSDLEDRLEDQMDRLEDQMDRMADMFERLLDRLEGRD